MDSRIAPGFLFDCKVTFSIVFVFLLSGFSLAQKNMKSKYEFSDYPVKEAVYAGKGHLSQTAAKELRKIGLGYGGTPLDLIQHKPNFAGHYEIIEWSCGMPCRMATIIDCTNGNIVGDINSCLGIEYTIDSYLIKTALDDDGQADICGEQEFYLLRDNKLIKLKSAPPSGQKKISRTRNNN